MTSLPKTPIKFVNINHLARDNKKSKPQTQQQQQNRQQLLNFTNYKLGGGQHHKIKPKGGFKIIPTLLPSARTSSSSLHLNLPANVVCYIHPTKHKNIESPNNFGAPMNEIKQKSKKKKNTSNYGNFLCLIFRYKS